MSSGVVTLRFVYSPSVSRTGAPSCSTTLTSSVISSFSASTFAKPLFNSAGSMTWGVWTSQSRDRSRLWEVHTPQVIEPALLKRGFAKVDAEKLEITDDVSVVEQLGAPVRLTLGEYTNLKVTTPDDMVVAGQILDQRSGKKWWKFWK